MKRAAHTRSLRQFAKLIELQIALKGLVRKTKRAEKGLRLVTETIEALQYEN